PPEDAGSAVGDAIPKTCRFNRIGVAAALSGNRAVICAITAFHAGDLKHIPGQVETGATVSVSGILPDNLTNPRLYVMSPAGEVHDVRLAVEGRSFAARLPLAKKGEHSIEVLADGPGGPQVVALRRVFAGVPPPQSPPPEPKAGEGLAGVEAAIGRLRAAHGLPTLQRDPELDAVAEGHSREMARLHTFAHALPSDGSLTDRLDARGYARRSSGENIGLSDDVATAHEAIVGSPAHLANLLDPRHRRLGLGAAKGNAPDGTAGVYLTDVLAAPIVGSAHRAAEVATLLAKEREKKGLLPLRRDPGLDAIAAHEVQAAALADQ